MVMLEGRSFHGSLAHLIAYSRQLSPASPRDSPEEVGVTEVAWLLLWGSWHHHSSHPVPGICAHVDTGSRVTEQQGN